MVDNYYFWVVIFSVLFALLSFKDVASIAIVQTFVALFRYLTLIMMLAGSFIILERDGTQPVKVKRDSTNSSMILASSPDFLALHSSPTSCITRLRRSYVPSSLIAISSNKDVSIVEKF